MPGLWSDNKEAPMNAHELAKILLDGPDLPIATHANNHTADGDNTMRVTVMRVFGGDANVCIGNLSRRHVNYPNEYVITEIDGGEKLPDNWDY